MWAVGETDLDALTMATNVTNAAFAIGSFCLGFAANILVSYGGAKQLTEMGSFMYYKCSVAAFAASLLFFLVGGFFQFKKGSLWEKIKAESRQVTPP